MGGQKSIKKKLKEYPEVLPFNELNNIDINFEKLLDLAQNNSDLSKKHYLEAQYLNSEKKQVEIGPQDFDRRNFGNIQTQDDYIKMYEYYLLKLTEHEKKYLWRQFLNFSSDGIISNRQFWSFLDMEYIYNTTFAKMFYKAACNYLDNNKLDYLKFMDYKKFIQFISIFTKSGKLANKSDLKILRIKFIFQIFDVDGSEEVDRLEFRNVITSFLEMILLCKFESEAIQEKVNLLNENSHKINLIEKVLDVFVDEIYNSSYSQEHLTYDEWEKWIKKIKGIENVFDFTGSLKYN